MLSILRRHMPNKAVAHTIAVYSILNPKHNVKVHYDGQIVEAALVKFAYKPLKDGEFGPKRDNPSKMVPASTWNYWQTMPLRNGHHNAYRNTPVPQFAVLVEEIDKFRGVKLLTWNGQMTVTQEELNATPILAFLSGETAGGAYKLETGVLVPAPQADIADPPADEDEVEDLPVIAPEVADAAYTGDPYRQDPETGHFIGDDEFRVPRDFAEFTERFPRYIENWVKRRLGRNAVDMDVEDWAQDLTIHMFHLPEKSKHRLPGANGRPEGCKDVVETFNPARQYGASERRFRHYINNCLGNRFSTIQSKRQKNPICRAGNLSLASAMDPDHLDLVDDEYVHANSEALSRQARLRAKQDEQKVRVGQLMDFIAKEDPAMLKVAVTLESTGTFGEAARDLGISEQELSRARNRLKQLGMCLENNQTVPKQRKPYKKREAAHA